MDHEQKLLPGWLYDKHFCTNADLQRLFGVSRSTIDRWTRERPNFPKKFKLTDAHGSITRYFTSDVARYLTSVTYT
ncbi:AlpA family phage regulatory protein [Paracoccus aestuarii]|uniref:AlpA family phage regulatory protein n=1 Tax=Paracoccus aestuarii TaxID=453842 RepID=A0A418ZR52_9RHOB|nr:AlpA family phage regulatory protein [Paracoccus aestuarii]WCR00537.1 AlpA family phage regulatory protein [Paracoccus aestuarii]